MPQTKIVCALDEILNIHTNGEFGINDVSKLDIHCTNNDVINIEIEYVPKVKEEHITMEVKVDV